MSIDTVDFSILRCVRQADRPLWKTRIHERLIVDRDHLPLQKDISAQTTGRRVDVLEEQGLLASTVVSAEDVDRHLIIGYEITADGEHMLDEKRETLLKTVAGRELFTGESSLLEKTALESLMQEEFSAGLSIAGDAEHLSREQLLLILARHFIEEQITETFSDVQQRHLRNVFTES